ncbi:MAG: pyridoxal-phosphate dependent enzyme [bacterium]|jgi:cysteine synthase|nr:pyridoxal-phosphate dependent enzyme [Planctomycetota bacterium]HIL51434.1 pyridoxal-phosphate dependent enzyme [Planctomycetota bacterium]
MTQLGLEKRIVSEATLERTREHFQRENIRLPTLAQLADPASQPAAIVAALAQIDPDTPEALNLFRVHWHNGEDRRTQVAVPGHIVLPEALTGVRAPILVALGNRFPMIAAHKVLAAYGCLVPRLVTGQFDLAAHRAVWPSTGNYCRGGVAISRILGCHGVAVLPEGMSAERFEWLDRWATSSEDIIRTKGSESNVKEIYDKCAELARDPANVIFNQFCEFGNHLVHYSVTGASLERIFLAARADNPGLQLAAFVSATGSAGTIAAGDFLKEKHGTRIAAVEALECATMLYNAYGEHNIQGIGDKHIPFVLNAMNLDLAIAISDTSTDNLNVLFNSDVGRMHLTEERGFAPELVEVLSNLGLSSICNVLAAIKTARILDLGPDDAILTVATDGAAMYGSERAKSEAKFFGSTGFGAKQAARVFDERLGCVDTQDTLLLSDTGRRRIFNLGYYTWVEQQGVSLEDFEARRSQEFWQGLRELLPIWDGLIDDFNRATGASGIETHG